jgi:hypothetical protein
MRRQCDPQALYDQTQGAIELHARETVLNKRLEVRRARFPAGRSTPSRHLHGIVSVTHLLPIIHDYALIACTKVYKSKYA